MLDDIFNCKNTASSFTVPKEAVLAATKEVIELINTFVDIRKFRPCNRPIFSLNELRAQGRIAHYCLSYVTDFEQIRILFDCRLDG